MDKRVLCTSYVDIGTPRAILRPLSDKRRHVQLTFYYSPKSNKTKVSYWKSSYRDSLMSAVSSYSSPNNSTGCIFISPLYGIYLVFKGMNNG